MRRNFVLVEDGNITELEGTAVEVAFGSTPAERIVAELLLLEEGLIEELNIKDKNGVLQVGLSRGNPIGRAEVHIKENLFHFELSATELELWIFFFLKYFLDKAAEVDHIDIEASFKSDPNKNMDLILKVPFYQPPVSGEEARRRLGL